MVKSVSIFGYSQSLPGETDYQDAFETAKLLAENGYTVVNGGGPGVMRAATEGARAGGGRSIGVIFNSKDMTRFVERDSGNKPDEVIECRNYVERTIKMMEISESYVIFGGGTGTISEFGMAWALAHLYFGKREPILLFGSFWHEIMEAFGRGMRLREEELLVYRIVTEPEEVLREVKEL